MRYRKLFEPVKIGNVTLKNRFVMPAMDSSTTTPEHKFSQQSIDVSFRPGRRRVWSGNRRVYGG